MGLPWRFISESAGMVTLVMALFVVWGPRGEGFAPGKLVRLMVVSSVAPCGQDAARTKRVYACRLSVAPLCGLIGIGNLGPDGRWSLPRMTPARQTERYKCIPL